MKRLLIIKVCGVAGEEQECKSIQAQAELYGIESKTIAPKSVDDLKNELEKYGSFDYIYLSTHGNEEGICNEDNSIDTSWLEFGNLLCITHCLNEDCILMLSCCRGGLNQVAYQLFWCCGDISYIVGPRQSLPPADMLISFNILLYNLTHRNLDPIVSCEKIKCGTDIRFVCFDRLEIEAETGYIKRYEELELEYPHGIDYTPIASGATPS